MNRRQFLAGFAAALAVHRLPKVLVQGVPSVSVLAQAVNTYKTYDIVDAANGGEVLWVMLYELDPLMRVTIDYRQGTIHLYSSYDRDAIRRVLWNYKEVGIGATINGEWTTFEDFYEELWRKDEQRRAHALARVPA